MGMRPRIKRVFHVAFTVCLGLVIIEPMTAANASLYQTNLQLQLEPGNTASYPGTGNAWYDISGSDGYVSFLANGKAIPGCKKVASSSGIATCLWKPSTHTASTISARLTPGVSYFTSSSGSVTAFVKARATTR